MTASGLISANGGMTVLSGQTLTVNGTLKSSSLDAVADATAGNTALTIGSIFVSFGELRRSFFGEILKIFFFIYIFRSCEEIVEGRG